VARVLVLASGSGTLLQALLDSHIGEHIVAVGSDVPDCQALERARAHRVSTFAVVLGSDRDTWNRELLATIDGYRPDLIVCAGFMRVLGSDVVDAFAGRIINSHPALLPSFPGAHAVRDALAYRVKWTGCTVHVVDHGVDSGPILAQQPVEVRDGDDMSSLHERIKEVERVLLVEVVTSLVVEPAGVRHG
jgi:phosphoribosylglycinamide formyltransferase-1